MWVRWAAFALILTVPGAVRGAERAPFHISQFPGDVTVNLTVTALKMSPGDDFDYDVTIGLTQVAPSGNLIFNDKTSHGARIKCNPGEVFVGGTAYFPKREGRGLDWKEDLWESVCLSPIS